MHQRREFRDEKTEDAYTEHPESIIQLDIQIHDLP
jgi:hypothetical protein